ncbi:unnamed protein product [Protopolystoma xenopodis]|uniref:Uncharacterized protein n=1 Tax=Protopolystoma xenopodis TaxID=117903 RepID=A0A448XIT2_9PLAT|nr:unnamed protein product [Protopolystoma xenopodis]
MTHQRCPELTKRAYSPHRASPLNRSERGIKSAQEYFESETPSIDTPCPIVLRWGEAEHIVMCGPITLAIYPDPSLSIGISDSGLLSGSLHCLVDPFLIFLVDRFNSVPVPVCISLQALFLNALEARTPSLH